MSNTATIQLRADSTQVEAAAGDLDQLASSAKRADTAVDGLGGAARKIKTPLKGVGTGAASAGKSMGMMKSRVQQVGFQVQDFVVQLQGGTSAFVAFGQQGSQLAGAFGPGGAILGAFIALGSVIGGVMAAQMANAGNAVDDLIDKLRDGTQEMDKLGEAQKRVFKREQLILISETTSKLASYDEKIADAEATLGRFQKATSGWGVSQELLDKDIKRTIKTLDDLNAGRETEIETLKAQKELLRDVALGVSKETRELEARNRERSKSAFSRVSRVGASPAEQAANEFADRKKIIDTESAFRAANDAEIGTVRKANAKQLADDLVEIEKNRADAIAKLDQASFKSQVGAAGQIAGNLAAIAKEGGKDQFENYKAFASAQAAINAAMAISGVLSQSAVLGPLAIPLSVSIGALAAVQIAQIQSQEFQPRALGGQMKAGGSFLVGERGPELVTMGNKNANIQAAGSFGGEQAVQVTNVFNISPGLNGAIQAEMMRFAPMMAKMSVQEMTRAMRKGGSTSKAMGHR